MKFAAIPTEAETLRGSLVQTRSLVRVDALNLGLILLGFAGVVALVPPVRSFPITDDWTYAQSVRDLLAGRYHPHDIVQPTAIAHDAWGAVFAALFGQSFTVLGIANLMMSAACLLLLYTLLRQLGVSPGPSLLGAALTGWNPLYVYLTYSFMTDVTCLATMLAACVFYVQALKGGGDVWLWLGGLASTVSYLSRQLAIAVPVAVLVYLLWTRSLNWRRALAAAAIPGVAAVGYALWARTQPPQIVSYTVTHWWQSSLSHPLTLLGERGTTSAWLLATAGLCLLPLLRSPRRPLLSLPIFGLIVVFQIRGDLLYGSLFPLNGNVVDHTGFLMFDYAGLPIWNELVWSILGIAGAASISLILLGLGESTWRWVSARSWRDQPGDPALVVYAAGFLVAGGTFILVPFVFDRYMLPLLPALTLPGLRWLSGRGESGMLWARWLLVLPLALFAVAGQRDYMEHSGVRWQAAENLAARGIARSQIDAGYEWGGWYLFDDRLRVFHQTHDASLALAPATGKEYLVADTAQQGYHVVNALPYTSWLNGGETRHVLVLKRD